MTFRETPTTPNRYAKPTNKSNNANHNNNANHENGVFASTPSAHTKHKGACSPMRNEWGYRNKDELQQAKPHSKGKHNLNKLC
jgi:hypothetical protein